MRKAREGGVIKTYEKTGKCIYPKKEKFLEKMC